MRTLPLALITLLLAGCGRGRASGPCANGGPAGFTGYPAACTDDRCRACAAHLGAMWARRADPAARSAMRLAFLRASADARDAFCAAHRPDGTLPIDHCTAGLAPGASCAMYSPYCVGVIADALRSGDTPLPVRVQLDVAVGKSCDRARDEIVTRLSTCAPFTDAERCESPACVDCLARHLAALTALAPVIERSDRLEQLIALVDATPEVLARTTVETLGAPDPPADIESTTAQRAVRHHCLSLTRRSATPPPFACGAVLTRLLSDPQYADAPRAWSALSAARPAVRAALLDALLASVSRGPSIPASVRTNLRALPSAELADALRRALARSPLAPSVYADLRAELARAAPPGSPLPPEVQPAPPAPSPAPPPTRGGGGIARPQSPPSREG